MRTFCHISEFGNNGYELIPSMILTSQQLKLWSPSSSQLKYLFDSGETYISPSNLLELIEEGYIQIIGRHEWLADSNFRNSHPWRFGKWNNDFDSKIYEWMIADENCTLEKKRIIIAPKETGYEWAKNFANTESNKEKLLFLKEKITKRKIPLGVLERFERITDEQERLLLLLQTIHNHYQAKENSGADISIEIDEWAELIYFTLDVNKSFDTVTELAPESIYGILNELSTLQFKRDFKSLKKILAYKDSIQSELIQLAKSRESLNEVCLRAIEKGVKLPTWAQTLTPTIGDTFSISSIFYSFMTFQVHPLSLFFLIGGTWRELVSDESIISRTFRKLNISKIKPSDKILPFVLAYGRDSVTYKEAKQLHQEILKITSTNV